MNQNFCACAQNGTCAAANQYEKKKRRRGLRIIGVLLIVCLLFSAFSMLGQDTAPNSDYIAVLNIEGTISENDGYTYDQQYLLQSVDDIMNDKYRNAPYIAFCEGDDYWTSPYKLQKQVDFLDKEPQYSMCFHSAEKKYECDGVSWINCENIEDKDYNATEIFVNWTIPTASVVCRKEALEFYSSLKGKKNIQNYDIFVFLSCAMVGQIRGMHDKMSVYRIQETGLTYNNDALVKCTMRNPEHFICLRNNFPIVKRKYVNKTIAKCLFERACLRKERLKSSEDLVLSLYYDPLHFFVRLIKYL